MITGELLNGAGKYSLGIVWVDPKKVNDTNFLLTIVESDLHAERKQQAFYIVEFTDDREAREKLLQGQYAFPYKLVHRLHYDKRLAEQYPDGYFDFP